MIFKNIFIMTIRNYYYINISILLFHVEEEKILNIFCLII